MTRWPSWSTSPPAAKPPPPSPSRPASPGGRRSRFIWPRADWDASICGSSIRQEGGACGTETAEVKSTALQEVEMRQVVIYPGEDGYWVAECPSLPGCVSQGKTREEAIANARDAIREYVLALEEDHLPVPPDLFEMMVVAV